MGGMRRYKGRGREARGEECKWKWMESVKGKNAKGKRKGRNGNGNWGQKADDDGMGRWDGMGWDGIKTKETTRKTPTKLPF